MDGGRGGAVYFFEHAREETERVTHEDGTTRLMKAFEALVRRAQPRSHFAQNQSHAAERVPEIRVLRDRVEFLD